MQRHTIYYIRAIKFIVNPIDYLPSHFVSVVFQDVETSPPMCVGGCQMVKLSMSLMFSVNYQFDFVHIPGSLMLAKLSLTHGPSLAQFWPYLG